MVMQAGETSMQNGGDKMLTLQESCIHTCIYASERGICVCVCIQLHVRPRICVVYTFLGMQRQREISRDVELGFRDKEIVS